MSTQDGRHPTCWPNVDDSDQILQVCCEPMKFNRSRQETNTSNTCPVLQFVADETSTGVSITREMGDESRTVPLKTLPRIPFQKA